MSHRRPPSRREFLAGVGAGAALVPLLGADTARAAAPPKRLLIFVWPEGVVHKSFWPKGGETDFVIDTAEDSPLKPLIPHQKDLIVTGGLALSCFKGAGHGANPPLLTGKVTADCPCAAVNESKVTAGGPSVDQFIAAELSKRHNLAIKSLVLQSTYARAGDRWVSFYGPPVGGQVNAPTPETDVYKLYDAVFGGRALTPSAMKQTRARKKSVLDFTLGTLGTLAKTVGTEDRQKLQQHEAAIREIEKQLDALGGPLACMPVARPDSAKNYNKAYLSASEAGGAFQSPLLPEIHKAQVDITVAAMACDLTRVATINWGDQWNIGYVFHWLGSEFVTGRDRDNGGFGGPLRHQHEIAHSAYDSPAHTRRKNLVDQWFFSQFAYALERLKAVKEGNGTMLDNTLVWMCNLFSEGASHSVRDMPWVLAGSCGGYFKTGRFLRHASGEAGRVVPHNGLLAEICRAMDVPVSSFGDPQYHVELPRLRG